MNKHHLSIATITWARDDKETLLLRESLLELSKLDLPTFITDGGSGAAFTEYIRSFPNFHLLETTVKGLWPQVQTSLRAAHATGAQFIVYTEPDKMDFFKQGLPHMLHKITVGNIAGVVIAARSAAGFNSYPKFQRTTETAINNCCAEATGIDIDYTYGPFVMNAKLVPLLRGLKETIGWGWRPYAFVTANRFNYTLEAFEGDYFCPVDQQSDDAKERIYRMRQLSENIEAIVMASTAILSD